MIAARRQRFKTHLLKAVDEVLEDTELRLQDAAVAMQVEQLVDGLLIESQPIVGAELTVLIADLRGFTTLSEIYPPEQVIGLLNRYFNRMSRLVVEHGGLIDKFMGDAVMALFGVPTQRADDLQRAIACAIAMQHGMQALNEGHEQRDEPALHAGIAVSTGPAMVGRFGSHWHSEYTAIGSTVNLAARIEAYSLRGQVLLSQASYDAAADFVEIDQVNEVLPKGKLAPIRLYSLRAITHPERVSVPNIEPRRSPRIEVDFPLRFYRVEDKKVLCDSHEGRVQDLGYNGMSVDLSVQLPPFTEVAIALAPGALEPSVSDVYARVLRSHPINGGYRTSLEFTSIAPPAQQVIKRYVDDRIWRG